MVFKATFPQATRPGPACYNLAMPRHQFVVPQFLDVEAKIIGPITARQFLLMLGTLLLDFMIYRIFLNAFVVLGLGVPILALGLALAFAKVNGQPFHYMLLSVFQTLRRPSLRVWDKTLNNTDLKVYLKTETAASLPAAPVKSPLERSRLSELSMIVNTGGVYQGDDH